MISKFGSIELDNLVAYKVEHCGLTFGTFLDLLAYNIGNDYEEQMKALCVNAGFFPYNPNLSKEFYEKVCEDMSLIDILCSYQYKEKYVKEFLICIKRRIDLDGFYAPFLWEHPWTRILKGKKVLVVHPFVDSIRYQYENHREKIWANEEVLPKFKELLTLKAIQSIADNKEQPFKNWFVALKYMEDEISKMEFDIAIIGCGAYGMSLAAHVKRMGKIAIHLAGWTQFLFGIYGKRWEEQSRYARFINEYWIRPNEKEKPLGADKVEGGCYW